MKNILLTTLAAAALVLPTAALADSYSVFKVCEDKHVIRTSDGQEAGHVEYIVVDPGAQRIVSTVITGGVTGERLVSVPYSSMRFGEGQDVTLTEITRERLVAAPVIERTQLTTTSRIEPSIVERSYTHFGVRGDVSGTTRSTTRTDVNAVDRTNTRTDVNVGTDRNATRTNIDANATDRTRTTTDAARDPNMRNQRGNVGTDPAGRDAAAGRNAAGATTDQPDRAAAKGADKANAATDAAAAKNAKATDKAAATTDRAADKAAAT